jgi:hypothetical protein
MDELEDPLERDEVIISHRGRGANVKRPLDQKNEAEIVEAGCDARARVKKSKMILVVGAQAAPLCIAGAK